MAKCIVDQALKVQLAIAFVAGCDGDDEGISSLADGIKWIRTHGVEATWVMCVA